MKAQGSPFHSLSGIWTAQSLRGQSPRPIPLVQGLSSTSVQSKRPQSPGGCASPLAASIDTCSPSGGHSPRNHRGHPTLTTSPFSRKHRPKTSFPPCDKESSNPKNSKTKKDKGNSISSFLLINSNPEKGDKYGLVLHGAVLYSYQGSTLHRKHLC